MTAAETFIDRPSLEKPLLIFKVGALGCMPLDTLQKLASIYDTDFHSSDAIRKELLEQRDASGMDPKTAQNIKFDAIRSTIAARTRASLAEESDVTIDMFFNGLKSRSQVVGWAQRAGALSIALAFHTEPKKIRQRVESWTKADSFLIPVNRWEVTPMKAAMGMLPQIDPPSTTEGIDYVFDVYGEGRTSTIIDQFDYHLELTGLIHRYEEDK